MHIPVGSLSVTSQGIGNSLMVELRRGLVFMDHMFIYPALNSIHVKFDSYVHTGAHEFHKGLFQKSCQGRRTLQNLQGLSIRHTKCPSSLIASLNDIHVWIISYKSLPGSTT